MKTIYNIFTFNHSIHLSRKQFVLFSIIPFFIIIVASIDSFSMILSLPNILFILFFISALSLYRLNNAGINKSISFIIIMLFILLFSLNISANFPTSSFTIEWTDLNADLIESAKFKLDLIIIIYYIYLALFLLFLFLLPASSKPKKQFLRIRFQNKYLKKIYYIHMTYYIYPLFKCLVFKNNFKISSKKFILFWLMFIIAVVIYFIGSLFYQSLLFFLRDAVSIFTGGEFENYNLGAGIVMVFSLIVNIIIFSIIFIKIFSSSITYRLYDFNRIKKHYIYQIVIVYCTIALFSAYSIFVLSSQGGYYHLIHYFFIIHAVLILIISMLPAKKY